ncbi:MAG: TetR/AcrR family transcriptional regulator [Erythrobacter sp.]
MEAAEQELAEKGVEAFSLRGVAKRAGVSHGAPAHHFGDARGLLTALAARGYDLFIDIQRKRQGTTPGDARAKLIAAGLGYIQFARERPALFRLMFASERPDRTERQLSKGATDAFEKVVADVSMVVEGDPHSDQTAMSNVLGVWITAHGLADLMLGKRFERIDSFAQMDTNEREHLFGELILRGISLQSKHHDG